MQFTRTNIITEGGTGKSLSSGGIVLEGNQGGGGGGDYIHPTGWLWGNKYTGRETLSGDLTSNGTIYSQNISSLNADITNLNALNANITNLSAINLTSINGDFNFLNVYNQLSAWGALIDHATIRDLYVSGSAHFVELIIDKINSTNGSLILSPAHATLSRVEERDGLIYCYFPASDGEKEISNDFDVDDLVICESFNVVEGVSHDVGNKFIWKRIIAKGTIEVGDSDSESEEFTKEHWFSVMKTGVINDDYIAYNTNAEFELGDVVCTLGNWTKTARQKAILMTATNPNFVEIGHCVSQTPYDIHVYDTENQYIRTMPIGVTGSDVGPGSCKIYKFDMSQDWNDCFYSENEGDYEGNIKHNYKFEITFRPHYEEKTVYDKTLRDISDNQQQIQSSLIVAKIKNYALICRRFFSNYFKQDPSTGQLVIDYSKTYVTWGLYYITTNSSNEKTFYLIRNLNDIESGKKYTLTITEDDNNHNVQPAWRNLSGTFNDVFDFGRNWNFHSIHTDTEIERCLKNDVFDLYSIKGIDNQGHTTYEYKPSCTLGENLITNGDFNETTGWQTNFWDATEGYPDFINEEENVYMRRPLCKEAYVYEGTTMGNLQGKWCNSPEFTLSQGLYALTFDYYVGNDNYLYEKKFYFQFSIWNTVLTDYRKDKIISSNKDGYHKCTILIGVELDDISQYDLENSMPSNFININSSGNYKIGINTDECGNENQLVVDNFYLSRVNRNDSQRIYHTKSNNVRIYGYPCTATQDSVDYRRYRNVIDNPIDAPAIITFNGINRFTLADKHVSVLSPTYNLISASSVSGFDDLASSVSSLSGRVTTCESNIETNAYQITLKVNQTDFNTLNNTVTTQGTRIQQLADSISLKADKTTVNTLSGEVSTLSSAYTQTAAQVAINVSSISQLNNTVTNQNTLIQQNASAITLKADQSTVNTLSGEVSDLSSSITVLSDRITLNSSAITSLNGSVSTLESEFSVIPGQISSIVSSISSLEGEDVRLWSSISQLPTEISAYVYNEIDGDLTQTGIDITNHTISLTADNFIVKNNNNNPTLYLNSQGLVESRLGFITNPRVSNEDTFNPIFYALSKNRFNNDPLAYSFGLSGYDKAIDGSPRLNQNPDYTDSVYIDHFKLSTEVFDRNVPQSASDPLVQYRIPILTMQQDDLTFNGGGDIGTYAAVANRTTLKIQPKEIAITWHDGGTPQLGLVKDLDGNDVPGIEGWIGGNDKIISIGPGGCYLKDAISTVIYTGQDSWEEWIRVHGTDTSWTNIPSGAMVRVKHYAGDSYSQVIIKD